MAAMRADVMAELDKLIELARWSCAMTSTAEGGMSDAAGEKKAQQRGAVARQGAGAACSQPREDDGRGADLASGECR